MTRLLLCLMVFGCTPTEPEVRPESTCPDTTESWHLSSMDTLGVLTESDICLPLGTAEALVGSGDG